MTKNKDKPVEGETAEQRELRELNERNEQKRKEADNDPNKGYAGTQNYDPTKGGSQDGSTTQDER